MTGHTVSIFGRLLGRGLPHLAVSVMLTGPAGAVSVALNVNLVENGNAEAGDRAVGSHASLIPAWEDPENTYGSSRACVVNPLQPSANTATNSSLYSPTYSAGTPNVASGFTDFGTAFFSGAGAQWGNDGIGAGQRPNNIAISQCVSLCPALQITDGSYSFRAAAWFGGLSRNDDSAFYDITFFDESGRQLGDFYRLGGITATDRGNSSFRWIDKALDGQVPAGACQVRFDVWFNDPDFNGNTGSDGAIDNISFVITGGPTVVPEPASAALFALAGLAAARRRRRTAR